MIMIKINVVLLLLPLLLSLFFIIILTLHLGPHFQLQLKPLLCQNASTAIVPLVSLNTSKQALASPLGFSSQSEVDASGVIVYVMEAGTSRPILNTSYKREREKMKNTCR